MKHIVLRLLIILFSSFLTACTASGTAQFIPTYTSVVIVYATPPAPLPGVEAAVPFLPTSIPADPSAPVWVANPADRTVLGVDPASNSVTAVISIDGRPEDVTAGEGAVWVLDRQNNRVFRIDPDRERVVADIPLPQGSAASITAGNGSVWVGMTGRIDLVGQVPGSEEELLPPGFIARINPRTNAVQEQFAAQPVRSMRMNGSSLWVLSGNVIETPLQVFDLATRQGMTVPIRSGPEWLPVDVVAVDNRSLWLYSAAYGKIFHAEPDGLIRSAVQLDERQPLGYPDLLISDSGLWALTTWGSVLRIDPQSNHILGSLDLNTGLSKLIASPGALWALSQQNATLYRIDTESVQVTDQIPTGSLVAPTIVPSPTPRIVLWKPCPDAANSRLKVGDTAYVTKDPPLPNRVRQEPNTEAEILGLINPGGGMDIIDGPSCSNGWVWWKVKNADLEGWTPEGDLETYWLIPIYQ